MILLFRKKFAKNFFQKPRNPLVSLIPETWRELLNRGMFPYKALDDFLVNLDGDKDKSGNHVGSLDWRYFLIEKMRSQEMPLVSVDYLHEIVFGCIRIVEHAIKDHSELPSRHTHRWRVHSKRRKKYWDWLDTRMNSDGWNELGERWEILWGPDYRGRYDLWRFADNRLRVCFSEIPEDDGLLVVDKRKEIETFDVEKNIEGLE